MWIAVEPIHVNGKSAEKRPLFREFWAQKPTHMRGIYRCPEHVMNPMRTVVFWQSIRYLPTSSSWNNHVFQNQKDERGTISYFCYHIIVLQIHKVIASCFHKTLGLLLLISLETSLRTVFSTHFRTAVLYSTIWASLLIPGSILPSAKDVKTDPRWRELIFICFEPEG